MMKSNKPWRVRFQLFCYRVSTFNLLILLACLPLIVFITPARLPFLIPLTCLPSLRRMGRGRYFPRTPFDMPIVLMVIAVGATFLVTTDWGYSLPKVVGLLYGIMLFYATIDWVQKFPPVTGVIWVILIGLGMASVGILGIDYAAADKFALLDPLIAIMPRSDLFDVGISANQIGGILTWVVPPLFALVIGLNGPTQSRPPHAFLGSIFVVGHDCRVVGDVVTHAIS